MKFCGESLHQLHPTYTITTPCKISYFSHNSALWCNWCRFWQLLRF
nr:MAG TPA: hypothetical protein [Caudoviricetes sp.]DAM87381.1 MAG TPA: hypothetical protein [Caudoviricetes sp.]